jgi:hypothetical protein
MLFPWSPENGSGFVTFTIAEAVPRWNCSPAFSLFLRLMDLVDVLPVPIHAISIQGVADDASGSKEKHVTINSVLQYRRRFGFIRVEHIFFIDEMLSSEPAFDEKPNLTNVIQVRADQ